MKILAQLVLILLILFACVPEQDLLPDNTFMIADGEAPWVIAHGGAKQLFPENTMVAFSGSVQIGVDMLEMDLRLTKDEQLVCHHDDSINRMSDGTGLLADFTLDELKQFNFGYGFTDLNGKMPYQNIKVEITPLENVFDSFAYLYFTVEIKDTGDRGKKAADVLYQLIKDKKLESRTIVASFDDEIISYFREISHGEIAVSASQKEATKFAISTKALSGILYFPEAVALQLPMKQSGINLAKKHVINSSHKHNMAMHYWTINTKEEMQLLIENGADGLITDRPDLMNELLDELGY